MRRIKKVGVIIFIIILVLISILFVKNINKNQHNVEIKTEITTNKDEVNIDYGYVIRELCNSNLDWSNYPLTKRFIDKYYDKNGLFYDLRKNITYDEINNTNTYAKNNFHLYLKDNKNFKAYTMDVIYYLDENNRINDMYYDNFELSDIGGAEVLTKHSVTENNYCYVFQNLCRNVYNPELALLEDYHEIDYVKTTKNFDKKHNKSDIYDTILDECPIEAFVYQNESDYEKRLVSVHAVYDEYILYLQINFVLDEKRYLDDYKITELKRVKEKYVYDESE